MREGEKAGEKEQITARSSRVVEINVARLIGATEECVCGLSGAQLPIDAFCIYLSSFLAINHSHFRFTLIINEYKLWRFLSYLNITLIFSQFLLIQRQYNFHRIFFIKDGELEGKVKSLFY